MVKYLHVKLPREGGEREVIQPQTRQQEQRLREHELRRAAEGIRREGGVGTTRSGRLVAGALRAMSAALTRTANALDAPCDGFEPDGRVIDRA
jgi:hypothetical protein